MNWVDEKTTMTVSIVAKKRTEFVIIFQEKKKQRKAFFRGKVRSISWKEKCNPLQKTQVGSSPKFLLNFPATHCNQLPFTFHFQTQPPCQVRNFSVLKFPPYVFHVLQLQVRVIVLFVCFPSKKTPRSKPFFPNTFPPQTKNTVPPLHDFFLAVSNVLFEHLGIQTFVERFDLFSPTSFFFVWFVTTFFVFLCLVRGMGF